MKLVKKEVAEKGIMSSETFTRVIDWAYDRALNGVDVKGVAAMTSAEKLAHEYLGQKGTLVEQVNALIRWQNSMAATSGFLTGLGGVFTLPIAIPANLASVMLVQVRMIAAIAHMGGYDLKDDKVRTLVIACLAGTGLSDILKDAGILIGKKIATSAIKSISKDAIVSINKAVGFRLLTKFGQTGAVNLGKAVPLVGGILGGAFDAATTNLIGDTARKLFIEQPPGIILKTEDGSRIAPT